MNNLATMIGVPNLELLMAQPQNTFVVLSQNGSYFTANCSSHIDHSTVVGIGTFANCQSLANYLNIQLVANK